jgi:hypothetical protein
MDKQYIKKMEEKQKVVTGKIWRPGGQKIEHIPQEKMD